MSISIGKRLGILALAGAMIGGMVTDAFAARARQLHNRGHYGYAYRHNYGNPAVGAAVAGTALGIIGLAAGAAAAHRYDDGYGYGNGYGYGYGAPGYYGPAPAYEPDGYDPF